MPNCGKCNSKLTTQALKIACNFHIKCVDSQKVDLETIINENIRWHCQPCAAERRKSMRLEFSVASGGASLDDVMGEIINLQQTQKDSVKEFNNTSDMLFGKIDDLKEIVEAQPDLRKTYVERTEALECEKRTLRKQLEDTQARVEETEQYTRVNCVEIQGVPSMKNEDVVDIVKTVRTAVDFEVADEMSDNCHRLGKSTVDRVPGIVVKLLRRIDKERFLAKKRDKKDLSTKHMILGTDLPVYVNESMCPARRKLYKEARQVKKDRNYKHIWLRGGKILMRKADGKPVVSITCLQDLKLL